MARHAYWVILVGTTPTAFRSSTRDVLVPTWRQLQRTQSDVTLRWFERGRLWESPEAARFGMRAKPPDAEKRRADWRPGGDHRDPRARFELTRDQKRARFKDRARRTREQPPPGATGSAPPAGAPPSTHRPKKPWSPDRPPRRPWQGPKSDRGPGGRFPGPPHNRPAEPHAPRATPQTPGLKPHAPGPKPQRPFTPHSSGPKPYRPYKPDRDRAGGRGPGRRPGDRRGPGRPPGGRGGPPRGRGGNGQR